MLLNLLKKVIAAINSLPFVCLVFFSLGSHGTEEPQSTKSSVLQNFPVFRENCENTPTLMTPSINVK